jgi:prephenate dehydrogenase
VLSLASHCRPGTLVTDVGSTKAAIVHAIEGRLPRGVAFVGSHPLAGSEKSGPDHAHGDLFKDRLVVVTPTAQSDVAAVERTREFWHALGARTRLMSPIAHDRGLALTSHLPHLIASALAGVLPAELFELTATGFRDTTRVAAGDPRLWTGIFRQNRSAMLEALDQFTEQLAQFRAALIADDVPLLGDLLTEAKKTRDTLDGQRDSSQQRSRG